MNEEVVDKIKKLRIAKGLNHSEMADKLNITRSAYQRLETGETYSWAKYLEELMTILELLLTISFRMLVKKPLIRQIIPEV